MMAAGLILGVALRFLMLASSKSFWGDEWFTMGLVQKPTLAVFYGAVQDVHPPFYFLLLHGVTRFLGMGEWALRSVSIAAGVGLLVAVYFLAETLFSRNRAVLALFLTAISPYWLQSSNEVRGYSLLAFLACASAVFFLKALKNPGQKKWVWGYGLFLILAVYTEHYAWFIWLAVSITVFLSRGENGIRSDWARIQTGFFILGLPSLAMIVFQAFFRENMFHIYRVREYQNFFMILKKVVGLFWHFSCGYTYAMLDQERIRYHLQHSGFFWTSAITALAASACAGGALARLFRRDIKKFGFSFSILVLPVLFLAFFYPIRLDARYLSFAAPIFYVLLADGFCRIQNRIWATVLIGSYLLVSSVGSAQAIFLKTDPVHKEDYLSQILYVRDRVHPKDATCGEAPQIAYYQKRRGIKIEAPSFAIWDEFAASDTSRFDRVWLLDARNMNRRAAENDFQRVTGYFSSLGFYPAAGPIVFGGDEGLTVVCLFDRKK
ncbi:MAG: glycosyltransferase family 39 protein [Candidatus Omnitrophica bacterium]|nr:glycosyltransferase family 39 protein [Candidatus Omnitrophota bacterium]